MLMHSSPLYRIYFGDARDKIFKRDVIQIKDKNLLEFEPFSKLKKRMEIEQLIFLHQVHGTKGLIITSMEEAKSITPFTVEGDFIITNVPHVGIGIITADCLPIIFFDKRHQVIAIAHAGWRSASGQIVLKVVDQMQKNFNTNIEDIRIIFGPSAKVCCYRVGEDFIENFQDFEFVDRVLQRRDEGLFFDLPKFNRILLEDLGIKKDQFLLEYNDCTVCDESFYSHRRKGEREDGRQMTVACLS